jgi:hypothetical protein
MTKFSNNTFKIEDLEQKNEINRLDLVILPKEEIIDILRSIESLKRKLQPLVNRRIV